MRFAVQRHRGADHVAGAAELLLPESVAEHRYWCVAHVASIECPSDERRNAHRGEKLVRDGHPDYRRGIAATSDEIVAPEGRRHVGQRAALFLETEKRAIEKEYRRFSGSLTLGGEADDQPIRIWECQRTQQPGVDDAEHRDGRAGRHCKNRQHDRGEPARPS